MVAKVLPQFPCQHRGGRALCLTMVGSPRVQRAVKGGPVEVQSAGSLVPLTRDRAASPGPRGQGGAHMSGPASTLPV